MSKSSYEHYAAGYTEGGHAWGNVGDLDLAESLAHAARSYPTAGRYLKSLRSELEGQFDSEHDNDDFVTGFAVAQLERASRLLEKEGAKKDVAAVERMRNLLSERVAEIFAKV